MNVELLYKKALAEIEKENYQEAVTLLTKAIEKEPDNPNFYSHRGVSYFHLGMVQYCLNDMDTAVRLEPNYGYRYASRAYIKSTLNDIKGAIADYEKAVELDPEDSVSYNNLGLMQERLGWDKAAQKNFKKADKIAELLEGTGVQLTPEEEANKTTETSELNSEKTEEKSPSIGSIFLDIFRKKETRKAFIQYLKNGFKT